MIKIFFILISTLLFASTQELQSVKLQLKWKHQFQFAGYYMAKEKGFYSDVGLDVDIAQWNSNIDILKEVLSSVSKHQPVYGVGYPSIILQRAKGAKIVLLNAMTQVSPLVLLTLHDSGIKSVKDFKYKRMMIDSAALQTASIEAMLHTFHISDKQIIYEKPTFESDALLHRKVDIESAYLSNEPYILDKKGVRYNIWNPADYGFDFYDDILYTSSDEMIKHAKRVQDFQNASLAGWNYAFTHIEESISLILSKYNTQHKSHDALLYEANELKKLVYLPNRSLGELNDEKIKRILDIYRVLGYIQTKENLKDFIFHFHAPISVEYVKKRDALFLKKIIAGFILILLVGFFIYKRERKHKKDLVLKNIVFDTIIDTIENPMFYKDIDGVYQNVNNSFARDILGIEKAKIEGKTLDELNFFLSDDEIAFFKEQDKKLFENKKNQLYETDLKVRSGENKVFRIQKNLFFSPEKEILGYVGFMYDITDMKKREQELEYIASRDPLTHLYNRRYFTQLSRTLLEDVKKDKISLSLMMLDIDNFKKVNDTYGHKAGDNVIIAVSEALPRNEHQNDISCRFGGEEFIQVLFDTTLEEAYLRAEDIRKDIAALKIDIGTEKFLQVTVSIGISQIKNNVENVEFDLETSIKEADDALYKAKTNGKNRVEKYQSVSKNDLQ